MKKPIITLAVLCLPAIGWLCVHFGSGWQGAGAVANAMPSSPGIPVMAERASEADVPIYLSGLGTVQAFNSVLVKSRVDGQVFKINFAEGQEVRAGDIIAEIDPRPYAAALAQAKAAKLKDGTQLKNAQLDLRRYQILASQNSIAHQQLDTQAALVEQNQAAVASDQAQIDLAELQLNYCSIRAPIDGRVGARLVDAGNIVRATDATGIVTINQVRPISVSFALPAASLPKVRTQLKQGDIAVIAEDGGGRALATGKLAMIDNQISAATATIAYKGSFDNADEALWPGQFVNIRLLLQVRRNALTVPVTAVVRGPEGTYAFVIGADRVVQKRPIEIGFANKVIAIVNSGLVVGEQIVTDGQYRIQAGSRVEILTSLAGSAASPREPGPLGAIQ
jgi:membrane fusion protein, multidrug efflux system